MCGFHRTLLAICLMALCVAHVRANNIQVTNPALNPQGRITFNISWENSWFVNLGGPVNIWDAAWVFVKFYDADSGYWRHAHLASGGHLLPSGVAFELGLEDPDEPVGTTNRVLGGFIHRTGSWAGSTSVNADIRWEYALDDVSYGAIDSVKVFAIEMVYVPQGAYELGSGGDEEGHFYTYPDTGDTYTVSSEEEIPVEPVLGSLYYDGNLEPGDHFGDQQGPIPADFPKGYAAFYIMKHEIAQQDYVDFLNTLTRAQQDVRTKLDLAVGNTTVGLLSFAMTNTENAQERQGIRCDGTIPSTGPVTFYCDLNSNGIGGEANDGQWLACNHLFWPDVAAYLDWCALRPMTELELVKAARGTQPPVANEYAWGTTTAVQAIDVNGDGTEGESSLPVEANAHYGDSVDGAWGGGGMRVGIFARSLTDRAQAGAGYYGALDLSGSLSEVVVTAGGDEGRAFQGSLGDGALDSSGNSTNADWPSFGEGASGLMGGSYFAGTTADPSVYLEYIGYLRISDRNAAAFTPNIRAKQHGGRGVRDAP